jgi:hypothetical protein
MNKNLDNNLFYKTTFINGNLENDTKDCYTIAYSFNNNYDVAIYILIKINAKFYQIQGRLTKNIDKTIISLYLKCGLYSKKVLKKDYKDLTNININIVVKDIMQFIKNVVILD